MMQPSASRDDWATPLAALVASIRRDWDFPGIRTAISKARHRGTPLEIATALLKLAAKSDLRTPAILADDGAHWGTPTSVPTARQARCTEDGHESELAPPYCRICRSEQIAATASDLVMAVPAVTPRDASHAAHIRTLTREPDRTHRTPDARERAAGNTRDED